MKNDNYSGDDNDDGDDDDEDRLLAVPFWIGESAREIAERKSRNLERTHGGGPALLVFFSSLLSRAPCRLSRKGLLTV